MTTGALDLPSATEATGVPAGWFITVSPDHDPSYDAMEQCSFGDLGQVELTYMVVEVTPQRLALGGTEILELDDGLVRDGDARVGEGSSSQGFPVRPLVSNDYQGGL